MADILSLSKARKARERAAAEQKAAENRARHGRSKAETKRQRSDEALRLVRLDGHALDDDAKKP